MMPAPDSSPLEAPAASTSAAAEAATAPAAEAAPSPSRLRRLLGSVWAQRVYKVALALLCGGGVLYLE